MCKLSINNMLWLALLYIVQNKHLPMLEALKVCHMLLDTVNVCVVRVRNYTTVSFFLFFLMPPVSKTTPFSGNFKANNGYFLQILDENWLDDT